MKKVTKLKKRNYIFSKDIIIIILLLVVFLFILSVILKKELIWI